jgi:hypothetical protein
MNSKLQPGKMNLTLVAYYGEKSGERLSALRKFINATQDHLHNKLGEAYHPYDIAQVHATIIGLEGTRIGNYLVNTNYLQQRQQLRAMALPEVLNLLKGNSLPFAVRIGGYRDGEHFPFTSRGLHPYLRSFSVQGDIAVAMGWPFYRQRYPHSLDRLRRILNEANVLHRYPAKPEDIDNDFYFVLGRVEKEKVTDTQLQSTQESMREYLARQKPINVKINRDHLKIVAYVNTKLPPSTTHDYSLEDAESSLDEIISMYPQLPA